MQLTFNMEFKLWLMRNTLIVFNFLFWLSGLFLIGFGGFVFAKYGDVVSVADNKLTCLPLLFIIIGCAIFAIGFLGCRGAHKNNKCMLTAFTVVMIVVLLVGFTAIVLGAVYRTKVEETADSALDRAMAKYNGSEGAQKMLDLIQSNLKCCGKDGPSDFDKSASRCKGHGHGVPSCHQDKSCSGKLYNHGCKVTFIKFVKKNLLIIIGGAVGVMLFQIIGIVFACKLMKALNVTYEAF